MAVKLISSRIFGECLPYGCSVLNCTSAIRSNTFPVRRHWENDCDMAVVFLIAHLRYALTISQSKSSIFVCCQHSLGLLSFRFVFFHMSSGVIPVGVSTALFSYAFTILFLRSTPLLASEFRLVDSTLSV